MDIKERQAIVKAMWNTGLTRAEIAKELGLTYSQVTWDVQQQGLLTTTRHHHRVKELSDFMSTNDVEFYKREHPPGTTVQDEDGIKYIVVKCYDEFCEVSVSRHYKTCLRWTELARVDWNIKRGRNPKMEEGGMYEDDNEES